jgi:transposase
VRTAQVGRRASHHLRGFDRRYFGRVRNGEERRRLSTNGRRGSTRDQRHREPRSRVFSQVELRRDRKRGRSVAQPVLCLVQVRSAPRSRGITAVIPELADQVANRKRKGTAGGRPVSLDVEDYRGRNVVERCFNRMKNWRGLTSRFDKLVVVVRGSVILAANRGLAQMTTVTGRLASIFHLSPDLWRTRALKYESARPARDSAGSEDTKKPRGRGTPLGGR